MDSDQNPWQYWQAGSACSHLTDTGGDEEVLHNPTTPHSCIPNFDNWQTLGGESWEELEHLSRLPDEPSWLNSDLENYRHNAFSSGPSELIEISTPSTNWEFRSQFRVDTIENQRASSELQKNFPVAGDGGVATAPGPGNLSSSATQGPLPKRLSNQKMVDGVTKIGKRHRGSNWTLEESRSFLQHMEVHKGKSPWKAVSDSLKAMSFLREAKTCEDHWGVLLADLKKFQNYFGSDDILRDRHLWPSVGTMSREQRSQNGLPLVFEEEWFEVIVRIAKERSQHRKSRREYSKGRIHGGGTPVPSSRRQQSRVSAASATPSSETFDNSVGDGDGISKLVKLLGSSDRSVTVDQTIEVMRIMLEARKTDLRRQEIEWERERMYQGQGNGLAEKVRRPPAAHE